MKRLAFAVASIGFVAALAAGAAPRDPVPVRFIGINDFHGHMEPGANQLVLADPKDGKPLRVAAGGAAAMAGLVKELRAGSPYSLMLAGGDLVGAAPLPSTLFRHETTVEVLGDIGLDVASVGNHEFDAGAKELLRLARGGCAKNAPTDVVASCATHPTYGGTKWTYLAANVIDAQGKPLLAAYTVRKFDGIPVGIIGAVTKTTPQLVSPSGVEGLTFIDEADAVNRAAEQLRKQGVRAMVAVFHEGIELGTNAKRGDWNDTSCPDAHGPLLDIASRLAPEIRVVFSGHTHQGYRCEIGGRLLIQSTSYGRGLSVVDVELDRSTGAMLPPVRSYNIPVINEKTEAAAREKMIAAAPAPFGDVMRNARPDAKIAAKVERFATMVAPQANRPVGRITNAFTRGGSADSTMGRLIADSQLAATKANGAQVAFMNPGGIRANLECAAGPCTTTFGQAFTVQPFGNSLVTMSFTGAQIKAVLESQAMGGAEPVFLQPSEGFTYTWRAAAPAGQHVADMRLAGQPVDLARTYRVTVNSFLAEGGDGFVLFKDGKQPKGGGQDLDALLNYLGAGERSPIPTPRINRER